MRMEDRLGDGPANQETATDPIAIHTKTAPVGAISQRGAGTT